MRGDDQQQNHIFSYLSPEARVRKDHPLRAIRVMVDEVLSQLSRRFGGMYATVGRPSIAPEKLLRAQLLQMLYSIRSERLLMEEMDLQPAVPLVCGAECGRCRLGRDRVHQESRPLAGGGCGPGVSGAGGRASAGEGSDLGRAFHGGRRAAGSLAGAKSFQPTDKQPTPPPDDAGNPTVNFRGEKRSNETHASKTDPDARLARKGEGKESKLSYCGNLLVENRNGLIVDAEVFQANGTAERDAALVMLEKLPGIRPVTVGGDKGFDTRDFVQECRNLRVTPHVAQNLGRCGGSAIDGRTTRHPGYAVSQRKRKRIEECFGWLKTIALMRKLRHRGVCQVDWLFTFACAAYNLVRMRNLALVVPVV